MTEARLEVSSDDIVEGTCLQMCPPQEIALREKQQRLHYFETVTFTAAAEDGRAVDRLGVKPKADPHFVVKEFSRSAAGKVIKPSELRPAHILARTMNYLIQEICSKDDLPWHEIYAFVFDRSRAVRQDLVIQRISGRPFVEIYEKICRFHILASYKLRDSCLDVFDPKINDDHTLECLKRLLCAYDAEYPAFNEARAEFEAYYLLYNLGSFEALTRGTAVPLEIQSHSVFRLATQISKSTTFGNFVRFFRMVKKLPYLSFCAVHKHINRVRADSLAAINTAYYSRNAHLPISFLLEILIFNDEREASDFCSHFGLEVLGSAVKLDKNGFKRAQLPKSGLSLGVDVKSSDRLTSELLNGCSFNTGPSSERWTLQRQGGPVKGYTTDHADFHISETVAISSRFQTQGSWLGKGRGRGRRKAVH